MKNVTNCDMEHQPNYKLLIFANSVCSCICQHSCKAFDFVVKLEGLKHHATWHFWEVRL